MHSQNHMPCLLIKWMPLENNFRKNVLHSITHLLLDKYSSSSVFVILFESNLSPALAFTDTLSLAFYEIGFGITISFFFRDPDLYSVCLSSFNIIIHFSLSGANQKVIFCEFYIRDVVVFKRKNHIVLQMLLLRWMLTILVKGCPNVEM